MFGFCFAVCFSASPALRWISSCEHKESAVDVARYPLLGSLREPQTAAVVTFMRHGLPAGNTHSHTKHIHSTAGTHWVMMGLSSPIKARSSRLRSHAQSIELDSSQEVLGPVVFSPTTQLWDSGGSVATAHSNWTSFFECYICVIWCGSVYYKSIFWTCCGQFNDHYVAQMEKQGNKVNQWSILQRSLIHD